MFGSDMLEVAIGLAFLFLVLSLFATTVREQVEAIFKTRAVHLERGIRLLLNDRDGSGVTAELYRHPLIYGLFDGEQRSGIINGFLPNRIGRFLPGGSKRTAPTASDAPATGAANPRMIGSNLPSYIPSRNFAMALLDLANGGASDGKLDLDAIRATAASLANEQVSRALIVAATEAKGDIDRARASLEAWFDGSMDRVAGWYKRESQWILLGIGFVLAAALNVDALHVAHELSVNTSLRRDVVAQVEATQSSLAIAVDGDKARTLKGGADTLEDRLGTFDRVIGWGVPGKLAEAAREAAKKQAREEAVLLPARPLTGREDARFRDDLVRMGPAAWPEFQREAEALRRAGTLSMSRVAALAGHWPDLPPAHPSWLGAVLAGFLGWLVTAFAISLGAPFWFDLLNKFMVIRSTVKPFEKSPAEGSEDRRGGLPAANALEPRPGATAPVGGVVDTAAGPPAVAPTQTVTLRLAVDGYDDLDPGTLAITVNGVRATDDDDDELIELPLAVGIAQTIVVAAMRSDMPVTWHADLTPGLDDESRPLAIALA